MKWGIVFLAHPLHSVTIPNPFTISGFKTTSIFKQNAVSSYSVLSFSSVSCPPKSKLHNLPSYLPITGNARRGRHLLYTKAWVSFRDVVAKVLDCDLEIKEFELQSRFRIYTHWEQSESPYPCKLYNITAVFLKDLALRNTLVCQSVFLCESLRCL